MKTVIDTNVLISALISTNKIPAQIIRAWRAREIDLLFSQAILSEYERVLYYPHVQRYSKMTVAEIDETLLNIQLYGLFVHAPDLNHLVSADPDDDKFLACAVAGEADVIVSGDSHLLTLGSYDGIPILTPAAFLTLLDERSSSSSD